jgi:anti-sigma factor RsiW
MTKTVKIDEWALHAFVDGEVAGESCTEIREALASDPELARTVDAWRFQRETLKRAYDGVLSEPMPAALTATLNRGGTWRARPYMHMAAGLAMLLLGGLAGWFAAGGNQGARNMVLVEEAIAAHQIFTAEVKHPVEVAAADKEHLQTWLSKRVGTAIRIPDLTGEGLTFLGGRLLVADDKPAAQLMYEDAGKMRLTVFLIANPAHTETGVRVEHKGDLVACYWLDEELGFAVAAEMPVGPMMKLAQIIYDQFEA